MGLDIVEFILATEERFNIGIPDENAQSITTPGKLIDYIAAQVCNGDRSGQCLTQRAFYQVRRALVSRLGTRRETVSPHTELTAIVPRATRQQD